MLLKKPSVFEGVQLRSYLQHTRNVYSYAFAHHPIRNHHLYHVTVNFTFLVSLSKQTPQKLYFCISDFKDSKNAYRIKKILPLSPLSTGPKIFQYSIKHQ